MPYSTRSAMGPRVYCMRTAGSTEVCLHCRAILSLFDPMWGFLHTPPTAALLLRGQGAVCREGDVERALDFVAFPDEEAASSSSEPSLVHRIPAYAPLMYHHGYSVAATAQVSAEKSVIFVGEILWTQPCPLVNDMMRNSQNGTQKSALGDML